MVRRKLLSLLENERRSTSPGTTTLMCQFTEGRLGCRGLKWLWERSNSDNEPARHIHAAHFLTTQIRDLNTRRFASAITKQWLVYRKGVEGRWKNTDEVLSIIYKEVSKLKKQVLTIQIFALIIFKQWPSLFQVINKQRRSAEQREIAVNMVSVFLDGGGVP
jgi:hypothetical protein